MDEKVTFSQKDQYRQTGFITTDINVKNMSAEDNIRYKLAIIYMEVKNDYTLSEGDISYISSVIDRDPTIFYKNPLALIISYYVSIGGTTDRKIKSFIESYKPSPLEPNNVTALDVIRYCRWWIFKRSGGLKNMYERGQVVESAPPSRVGSPIVDSTPQSRVENTSVESGGVRRIIMDDDDDY
jgi:hypothetical protein